MVYNGMLVLGVRGQMSYGPQKGNKKQMKPLVTAMNAQYSIYTFVLYICVAHLVKQVDHNLKGQWLESCLQPSTRISVMVEHAAL